MRTKYCRKSLYFNQYEVVLFEIPNRVVDVFWSKYIIYLTLEEDKLNRKPNTWLQSSAANIFFYRRMI